MKKLAVLFIGILLISGCVTVATGPLFTSAPVPLDTSGVLYVFEKVPSLNPSYSSVVKINGKPFVGLEKMGYSYTYLLPGIYTLSFGDGGFVTKIEIKRGQETFEEFYSDSRGVGVIGLENDEALEKIKDYRYIEPF